MPRWACQTSAAFTRFETPEGILRLYDFVVDFPSHPLVTGVLPSVGTRPADAVLRQLCDGDGMRKEMIDPSVDFPTRGAVGPPAGAVPRRARRHSPLRHKAESEALGTCWARAGLLGEPGPREADKLASLKNQGPTPTKSGHMRLASITPSTPINTTLRRLNGLTV